jgi:predicted RNA binding protein YcfA (HicA-like mRNA interferase family)
MNIRKICKLLRSILKNPKHVRFEEIDKLLKEFGFEVAQPQGGSSHYVYRKNGYRPIVIPFKRPFVREFYIKDIIKILNLEEFQNEKCSKRKESK